MLKDFYWNKRQIQTMIGLARKAGPLDFWIVFVFSFETNITSMPEKKSEYIYILLFIVCLFVFN